jgi:hypothetical protein
MTGQDEQTRLAAFCGSNANQLQLVHVYDGEWLLAGMAVREEHNYDMNIIFGKYRGKLIEEIFQQDAPYLEWVANNFSSNKKKIVEQLEYIKRFIAPYVAHKQQVIQQLGALRVEALAPAARAAELAITPVAE